MVRDRVLETLRLAAPELKSGVSAIPPIPHIVVPFTLTVSLKSGWGFRHRTETEGVKVPFATITTIPNIQTALFIQPTAIGTVYEDLGGVHKYQLRLTQPNAREASSSCTISLILDVTLPTRLGLRPIALHTYFFLPQQHYITNVVSFDFILSAFLGVDYYGIRMDL